MSDPQTKTGEFPPILLAIIIIVGGVLLSSWVLSPPDRRGSGGVLRQNELTPVVSAPSPTMTVPSEQVQRAMRPPTYDELLDQVNQRYEVEYDPMECQYHYPAC